MSETELDHLATVYRTPNVAATSLSVEDSIRIIEVGKVHKTIAMLSRYCLVGVVNTVIGYTIILFGLWLGMGDYFANAAGYAVGLTVSYVLQRQWAFAVSTPPSFREAGRFCGAAILAYGANISVLHIARSLGYVGSPVAQAIAMVAYSLTFFVLSRFVVFAQIV